MKTFIVEIHGVPRVPNSLHKHASGELQMKIISLLRGTPFADHVIVEKFETDTLTIGSGTGSKASPYLRLNFADEADYVDASDRLSVLGLAIICQRIDAYYIPEPSLAHQ